MNWSAASRPLSVSGADDAGATGQYANLATVTGQPVESSGLNAGPNVTDTATGPVTNANLPSAAGTTPMATRATPPAASEQF